MIKKEPVFELIEEIKGTLTKNETCSRRTNRRIYEAKVPVPCLFCSNIIAKGDYFIMARKESKPSGKWAPSYPKCNNCAPFTVNFG